MSEFKMSDADIGEMVGMCVESALAGFGSVSVDPLHIVEIEQYFKNQISKLTAENKRLREALIELVETSMSNERQLAESFLEKFEPSSALIAANNALSQEGE